MGKTCGLQVIQVIIQTNKTHTQKSKNSEKDRKITKFSMQEWLFQWSLILHPVFIIMDTTILVNSAHSFWEKMIFLRFHEKDSLKTRAISKSKYQHSLSSFSKPNTLDFRFFSSPCILCARLLLSRTSHRMARSWFARALAVAQRFKKRRNDDSICQKRGINHKDD